jgi:predicted nucleic acid-binding protein
MIILDTNVVSEAARVGRNPVVVAWLDAQAVDTLYFTATSLSELMLGVASLPGGKRKSGLTDELKIIMDRLFGPRILPFNQEAALTYAALVGSARAAGRAVSVTDGQIGAIASVHRFSVATRDTAPFAALGVPVINPWNRL